jgi:hypothetical protein
MNDEMYIFMDKRSSHFLNHPKLGTGYVALASGRIVRILCSRQKHFILLYSVTHLAYGSFNGKNDITIKTISSEKERKTSRKRNHTKVEEKF